MKKIGLLGGTFDPPHFGHLLIANEVLANLQLDELWFLPNQEPPHKKKPHQISHLDRLNMLKLATKGHPRFKIETIELNRPGPSFTYDTMVQLNSIYPSYDFNFIIGADMIEYLPKWHRIEELINMVTFVGVKRPSYSEKTSYPIIYTDIPEFDVSSSMIRKRLEEGKTTKYLLPDAVREYIKENKLYGSF